jgi:CDP-diacylglycerol--serine O-phosphatidyltransferase
MFNLANLFTAANMICGFISIILTLAGRIDIAPLFILGGALLDFFDGFIARKLKIAGPLGKQLDSLADMITFGVAPGVLMLVMIILGVDNSGLLIAENGQRFYQGQLSEYVIIQELAWIRAIFYGEGNYFDASIKFLPFVAMAIPFFSMFRLAKFNIDENQSDKFIGVPTPLNTIFFLFFPLYFYYNLQNWGHQPKFIHGLFDCYTLSAISVLFSLLMVSNISMIALKFKNWTWKDNYFRFSLIGLSLIIIPLLTFWAIPIIVFLYLFLSLIENYQTKKKNEIQS